MVAPWGGDLIPLYLCLPQCGLGHLYLWCLPVSLPYRVSPRHHSMPCRAVPYTAEPLHVTPSRAVLASVAARCCRPQVEMVGQIAGGMEHVSRSGVVHRDLCLRHCLVGARGVLKVSHFGSSYTLQDERVYAKKQADRSLALKVG